MERTIFFNGESIHYHLQYKKVKNVNIRIAPDGAVQVSANRHIGAEQVDRIVQKKAAWIIQARINYAEQRTRQQMPKTYQTGEPVRILGQTYHLQVETSSQERISIDGENVCLWIKASADNARKEKLFDRWYRALSQEIFKEAAIRIYLLFDDYRIPMPAFSVRKMKTRWGSCSPKKQAVTLNLYLLQAPISCIEYVIAHELAHLVQPDHSAKFYAVLDQVMPDHRERKQLLHEQKIDCSGIR